MSKFQIIFLHMQYSKLQSVILFNTNFYCQRFAAESCNFLSPDLFKPRCLCTSV